MKFGLGKIFNRPDFDVFKDDEDTEEHNPESIITKEETDSTDDGSTDDGSTSDGTASDIELSQVTKLGVTATTDSPKVIDLAIDPTVEFNKLPVEVLKFADTGTDNVVETMATFDNADADNFEDNPFVVFDGTMHLKTEYVQDMIDEGILKSYTVDNTNGAITFNDAALTENTVTAETLTNSGDDLTFTFSNTTLKSGSITAYEETDETADISSIDHMAGNITFANTHVGEVVADYVYNTTSAVSGEGLTNSGDDLTFTFANTDLQHGSIVAYEDGTEITSDISSIDHVNGSVTFTNTHTGSVTADYEYVTGTNSVTGEALANSGDDLTFTFANTPLDDGSITVYETNDITSDISSTDLDNGSITFATTHTGTVTADYIWIDTVTADYTWISTTENSVADETLTNSGDDLTFTFANTNLKDGSIIAYEETDVTAGISSTDHMAGSITFANTHVGEVVADYTYNTTSAVSDESLTDSGDSTTFEFANTDLQHGSITVYEDGTDVTSDVSSIDHANGSVTFSASKSGTITADYEYVTGTTSVTEETLTNSGDDLTFTFANTPLDDGSITVYETNDITSDISSTDLTNGSVTFANTHTGTVTADYVWISESENAVTGETLTTSDNQTFNMANSSLKDGSVTIYRNAEEDKVGKMWSQTIDLTDYKKIDSIEVV